MTSEPAAGRSLAPIYVVSLGFVALALSYSIRAVLSMMMPIWEADLDWSRSFISGVAALAQIVIAIFAPLGGRLVDLYGSRSVLVYGLLLLAIGCAMIAAFPTKVMFVIGFGIISAIGFGLIAVHVVSTAVEQKFDKNQGLATGIATSGSTAGQILVVPVVAFILISTNWQTSYVILAGTCVAMMILLWRLMPRHTAPANVTRAPSTLWADTKTMTKIPTFHILFWSYLICGYTTAGVIETHFLPYAAFCGFPPVSSATVYGVLSVFNLIGMIAVGWLTDRMNRPLLLGMIYIIRGITFIILMNVGASIELLVVFAVIFGLVDYSTVPVTASLVASHIGKRTMGLAFGYITAGHGIGGALGAFLGGYLFDIYLEYDWVWISSLLLAVASGLIVFLSSENRSQTPPQPA